MVEIIAEIGINHNGSLELAKEMIDIAAAAGCHYVKFQKRDIDEVYTKEMLDAPRESPWGTTNRDQKEALEFGRDEYDQIDRYCRGKIPWFATPWDGSSMQFLEAYDLPFLKVPSARVNSEPFLKACRQTGTPIILSTGMSDMPMIERAVEILGVPNIYGIMHCTSTYPTKTEELNLNCIKTLKRRFPQTKIGFSNHHPGIIPMATAVALGAEMLEFHMTRDRAMYGSDQAASIEQEGAYKIVKYAKSIEISLGDGQKRFYDSEQKIAEKLR